jgi:hypothetical protein
MIEAVIQFDRTQIPNLVPAARVARMAGLGLRVQVDVPYEPSVMRQARLVAQEFGVAVESLPVDERTVRMVFFTREDGSPADREPDWLTHRSLFADSDQGEPPAER